MCSRKNFKLLFCAGIALAIGVWIYIFFPMRMTDAILPGSPPKGNIKDCTNHFSPSLLASLLASSRTSQPTWQSTFTLLHWLSLTYFEQSTKHHEESTSKFMDHWCLGKHSSFIFPSKPMDPQRNKLDISTPALT